MTRRIAILDLGASNRANIAHALMRCGADVAFVKTESDLRLSDALVLAGVANVGYLAGALEHYGLRAPLLHEIEKGKPLLAICAGFQLLFEGSEEAPSHRCLGVFRGAVRRVCGPRAQHVGWNHVVSLGRMMDSGWAYFAHGFSVDAGGSDVCAIATFGAPFAAAARRENVFGVQFHPERSGVYGAKILERFITSMGRIYAC